MVRVASYTLVLDVGDVAVVTVDVVSYGLETTVGKLHSVDALGVVTVTGLLVVEVVAGGVVLHRPLEVVLGLVGLVGLKGAGRGGGEGGGGVALEGGRILARMFEGAG